MSFLYTEVEPPALLPSRAFCFSLQTHIYDFEPLITTSLLYYKSQESTDLLSPPALLGPGQVPQYLQNKQVAKLTWATRSSS